MPLIRDENNRLKRVDLTEVEKDEIRNLYKSGDYSFFQLGSIFGVSGQQISNVVNKKRGKKKKKK